MIEADDAFQRYAEANHIEINKDDQVTMNIRRMDHDAKGLIEELKQDSATKQLRDSINIVDEENDFAPVSDAEREKLFNGLLESAKNQVISDRAAEDELFKLSADKRRQEIRDSIKSTFQNKMLVAIGASNDMHLTEATKKKSFSFQNYARGVIRRLAEITNNGKKADVHKGQLINSMVDTQLRMEERAKLYRQLGMVNAANAIEKQKTGFVSKMKGWFGKAYEMRHAVADNMKNNKYKYITMGLAGVGVAVTTPHVSAGKAAVIAAGYAAFIGAGSVVWPLIEKREAMLRQAKKDKNDELIAELNNQGKVKSLWNIYKSMEGEEKKRYLQRAAVNTAAGVAGGLLIGAAGFVGQEANMATLVNAKLGASTMRIFGNLGVQSKFMVEDHRQAKKDQTEVLSVKPSVWLMLICRVMKRRQLRAEKRKERLISNTVKAARAARFWNRNLQLRHRLLKNWRHKKRPKKRLSKQLWFLPNMPALFLKNIIMRCWVKSPEFIRNMLIGLVNKIHLRKKLCRRCIKILKMLAKADILMVKVTSRLFISL